MIDHLAELLNKRGQPYEHLLAALLSLVRDHPQAQEECKRPDLYFYNILIKLREHSIIHENLVGCKIGLCRGNVLLKKLFFQDQRQHCQELLTLLYNETFYS